MIYRIVKPTIPLFDPAGFPNDYEKYRGVYRNDWDDEVQMSRLRGLMSGYQIDKIIDDHLERGGFVSELEARQIFVQL